MSTLWRFGWRELRRTKTRTAILALVFTALAAALGGGYLCEASLDLTRETWSTRLHLADLEVRFVPAAASEMPPLDDLRAIPGVRAVVRRFLSLGHVEREGAQPVPVLIEYIEPAGHPPVNDVAVLRGGWLEPGHPDRALVDRSFAAGHRIEVGDVVVVNPHRFAARFVVAGVGLSA